MTEQTTEERLQALGLNAPRITPAIIDALVARLVDRVDQPAGTTSTFVHLYLDGKFLVATGHSACVSPENFNPQIGIDIAMKDAMAKAKQKLWELEGYALYKGLNHG